MTTIDKDTLFRRYGNYEVKFDTYYKYTFVYIGKIKLNEYIYVSIGGDASDIYKLAVDVNEILTINELLDDIKEANIFKNGKLICKYINW